MHNVLLVGILIDVDVQRVALLGLQRVVDYRVLILRPMAVTHH